MVTRKYGMGAVCLCDCSNGCYLTWWRWVEIRPGRPLHYNGGSGGMKTSSTNGVALPSFFPWAKTWDKSSQRPLRTQKQFDLLSTVYLWQEIVILFDLPWPCTTLEDRGSMHKDVEINPYSAGTDFITLQTGSQTSNIAMVCGSCAARQCNLGSDGMGTSVLYFPSCDGRTRALRTIFRLPSSDESLNIGIQCGTVRREVVKITVDNTAILCDIPYLYSPKTAQTADGSASIVSDDVSC